VIVVDDDATHRVLLQDILEPLGFLVFAVGDGNGCIDLAASCNPDLILLDISMPGMTGWETARMLRTRGHNDVAIVMISADAHELTAPRGPDMLHDDYLVKPFDVAQLLDRIHTLLGLEWEYAVDEAASSRASSGGKTTRLARRHIDTLQRLGEVKRVRGIESMLRELEDEYPASRGFLEQLRRSVESQDFDRYMASLEAVKEHAE
jgi:DNA-binding response OmpR family regulator